MAKKILLVDDDPKTLVLEKTILTQGGFSVETASSGNDALTKLEKDSYDGIILDVLMPEMDGYEVAKKIRQLEECKTTPIVMVTASTDRHAQKQGFQAGAAVFMTKPFTASKLISILHTVLKS